MKKPKGFFTYFHHIEVLEKLSDEQAGRLYKALTRYGDTGELTEFPEDPACEIVFTLMRGEIDANFERYSEVCEKRREAGKKGGRPPKEKPFEPSETISSADLLKTDLSEEKPIAFKIT